MFPVEGAGGVVVVSCSSFNALTTRVVVEQPSFRGEAAGREEIDGAAGGTDENSLGASLKQLHAIADDAAMPSHQVNWLSVCAMRVEAHSQN